MVYFQEYLHFQGGNLERTRIITNDHSVVIKFQALEREIYLFRSGIHPDQMAACYQVVVFLNQYGAQDCKVSSINYVFKPAFSSTFHSYISALLKNKTKQNEMKKQQQNKNPQKTNTQPPTQHEKTKHNWTPMMGQRKQEDKK